jgi:WD40 repeat protein
MHTPCTPKLTKFYRGDRFIPSRAKHDNDIANFKMTTPTITPTSPAKRLYSSTLSNNIFSKQTDPTSRILSFNPSISCSPKRFINQSTPYIQKTRRERRILPTTPIQILDCPDLSRDFYFNLLDWGSSNLLSVGLGKSIYVYDVAARSVTRKFNKSETVTSLAFNQQNPPYLASGSESSQLQIWDVEHGLPVRSLDTHSGRICALAWNKSILTSGSKDTTIQHHDLRIRHHLVGISTNHSGEICSLRWSPDHTKLASGSNDNQLLIWEDGSFENPLFTFTHHRAAVKGLAWCPWENATLASGGGSNDMSIKLWNVQLGSCVKSVLTSAQVTGLEWSNKNRELMSSEGFSVMQQDTKVNFWKWRNNEISKVGHVSAHDKRILAMKIGEDDSKMVTLSEDESIKFWNIDKPQRVKCNKCTKTKESTFLR